MLSISTIARVIVNASRAVSVPTSFDTGLLLIKDSNFTAPKRLRTYDSAAAAIAGLMYEEEGALLRRRADLVIALRVRDTLVRENRRPGIAQPPAVNIVK